MEFKRRRELVVEETGPSVEWHEMTELPFGLLWFVLNISGGFCDFNLILVAAVFTKLGNFQVPNTKR